MDVDEECADDAECDEGGPPVDDKHDDQTDHGPQQADPHVVESKRWPPA